MDGLLKLSFLPDETKARINKEFGSAAKLYMKIYDLEKENYSLHKYKPAGYQIRQREIENIFNDIKNKLYNAELDGHAIVTGITSDFSEVIAKKIVRGTDDYLQQLGTSFEEMREWLRRELDE